MTIQEAKWETRLAIWQQHIHLNAFLEHSEIEISLFDYIHLGIISSAAQPDQPLLCANKLRSQFPLFSYPS